MIDWIRQLSQLVSLRELRNALLGFIVVIGGLGLAMFTLYAHRTGNIRLAGIAAAASLVFVLLIIIFVIPPLARSASAEASQMNLPFEFTTGGAISIGLLVIVAFAAWNTGNNLLFLVLSFFSSALFVGFLSGNICLRKLDVKMRFPEAIFAGEETPILVGLNNRKRLFPTISVTTEVRGRIREHSKFLHEYKKMLSDKWAKRISRPPIIKHTLDYFVYVSRKSSTENKVKHIFGQRGRFVIRDFELSTRFPFGFFRHRRRLPTQKAEIIVFPKLGQIEHELSEMPLFTGKLISSKKGSGQDLFALRDYQPTDDFRHIDWKATARSNHLTIREFTAEDEKRVTVVLDPNVERTDVERSTPLRQKIKAEQSGEKLSYSEMRFENGVSIAASILSIFANQNADTRLVIGHSIESYGSGVDHLNQAFEKLALVEAVFEEDKPGQDPYEIFPELTTDEGFVNHIFLVTTKHEKEIPSEIRRRVNLVRY